MDPYIPSYTSLGRHPKLIRLAARLKISKITAVGHLQYFWWWCMSYAADGDISEFMAEEIAAAAEWGGDPEEFRVALEMTGFIEHPSESAWFVHDWDEYGGKLIAKKQANARRQSDFRNKPVTTECDITVTSQLRNAPIRVEESRVDKRREEEKPTANGDPASLPSKVKGEGQKLGHILDDPLIDRDLYVAKLKGYPATVEEIEAAEAVLRKRKTEPSKWTAPYLWKIICSHREEAKSGAESVRYDEIPTLQKPNRIVVPEGY